MIQKIRIDSIEDFISFPAPNEIPDDIRQLADSIKDKGLLHPIAIVQITNNKYKIVAGRRRLRALMYLGEEEIEAKVYDGEDKSLVELEIIGLHENLQRHNLPWHEEVVLTKKLHDLRLSQKGVSAEEIQKRGVQAGGEKKAWTMRDTAEELGIALGKVSTDIQLATAIAINPSLKNIKDKETAMKMIKVVKKQVNATEDVAYISFNIEANQVLLGDSLELLKLLPANTFHACITDPPWLNFLGEDKFKRDGSTLKVFQEVYRVLKYDSFLYVFLGMDDYLEYITNLQAFNFTVQKYPLIWSKPNVISRGTRAWEYGRDYEFILVAVKGSPAKVTTGQESSVITVNAIHPTQLKHPNEKPIEVIERLISDCTPQGALILDPFAGSGKVAMACKQTLRHYYVIEKEKSFYDLIVERLK